MEESAPSDPELLSQWLGQQRETAFHALVESYASLVHATARYPPRTPAGSSGEGTMDLKSHPAAVEWLSSTPDGPVKDMAIDRYVEVLCKKDSESAAHWARKLPEGKNRDLKLRMIYQNWPAGNAAARDSFAEEHGIN
jgi:hypothetical protein